MPSVRKAFLEFFLGPPIHSQMALGFEDPQSAVDVWLHGLGDRLDVTHTHLMACGAPLTIGIGLEPAQAERIKAGGKFALRFQPHGKERRMGEIGLRFDSAVQAGTRELCLFHIAYERNDCLPRLRRWLLDLQLAKRHRQIVDKNKEVPISVGDSRAMAIFYLCPRPVTLVTVVEGDSGNMFPMNVMGSIGNGYFAFGLNRHRAVAPLVDRVRRVVLSSVPIEQSSIAIKLSSNHRKSSIEWMSLPFETIRVDGIHAPVPTFALRVREMQVEAVHHPGSHMLFVAKTVADKRLAEGEQWCSVHGLHLVCKQNE